MQSVSQRPLIFVSAVTRELESARQLVANTLTFLGYEPVWQDLFGTEGGDLRELLRQRINQCNGVVQLVGHCYGAEPPKPDEKFGRVSYTQYEALYAREREKKVWYLFIDPNFPADSCADEPEEERELQTAYRRRLETDSHLFHPLTSREALEASVLKLRDDLTGLRRGAKRWAAAVALLLVLSVALGLWLLLGERRTQREVGETKQALASMTAEISQLRKGIVEFPHVEAQVRQNQRGDDPSAVQDKVYAELAKQLGIDPKTLREKLPQFADQLKRASDASSYERATAAYVARDFAEAERLATLATNQAKEAYPPKAGEAIKALELAGWASQQLVHSSDALRHFRAAEALTDRDRDPIIWARVQHGIARLLLEQGRYSVAESVWRDVVDVRTRSLGAEDPDTLRSRAGLAVAIEYQGNFAEAEAENRAILAVEEKLAGHEHPDALASRNNLAETLRKQGKFADAEAEYRDVIKSEQTVFGAEHRDTLRSRNNLAIVLNDQKKYDEAETEFRDVIRAKERQLGAAHPDTLNSRNNLANSLSLQRKFAEAEQEYRSVIAAEEKVIGADHPNTLMSRYNLAMILSGQGKFVEAEAEFRRLVEREERILGRDHPDTLRARLNFAMTLARERKVDEAREQVGKVLASALRVWGPENPLTHTAERLRDGLSPPK
ncbi:MAG TPA: tetratricopeptide repeat protein [Chthoniobacterales bacterium]|nr:tetratricopeptide repeat protein [Chthoniobacterales bacterium]